MIFKDSVSVKIGFAIFFRIINPISTFSIVSDHVEATLFVSQGVFQKMVSEFDVNEFLSNQDCICQVIEDSIDSVTRTWGVKIEKMEFQEVHIPKEIQRALSIEVWV